MLNPFCTITIYYCEDCRVIEGIKINENIDKKKKIQ